MLRQDKPTHPEYLAMMKCIEERRDEKVRIADQLREFRIQTMNISAKANRAQILTQYQQDVRAIREKYIERLGREWYEIQHDRRTFAGTPTDYGLRMPTKRSEQVRQHVAYTNEVSVLAGVAKHIGFPAAPQMNGATAAEYEEDMERMGVSISYVPCESMLIIIANETPSSNGCSSTIPRTCSNAISRTYITSTTSGGAVS